jgi:chemotaxis protein CheD
VALEVVNTQRIMLSLGEWAVSDDPERELVCLGLGSCVAFCAYDTRLHVAGMAHMVLPDSEDGKRSGAEAKFVDVAIPLVIGEMQKLGALINRLHVHLVGGAQMLTGASFSDSMMIGQRNVEAAHAAIKRLRLPLTSEDTGGDAGRTVRLAVASGELEVSSPRRQMAAAA